MKKEFLLLFVWMLIFGSCQDDRDNLPPKQDHDKYVVLKERDPNHPWVPVKRKGLSRSAPVSIGLKDCVGRSLKCDAFPIENMENLGYPVIDMDKFTKDYPGYFTSWRLGNGFAESYSYASFDRFLENSSTTKKVGGGLSLNLGIFKIGAKRKVTKVFTKSYAEDSQSVFGMLSVLIRDSCYNLQLSSNIKKKIVSNYLHEIFKDELYNTSPSEFFSNYGGFVLSRYITGGKALGFYCGTYNNTEKSETKERDMNTEISGSYGFKNVSASADLGIGKNFADGSSSTNKFSSLQTSIQTVGGSPEFAAFSIPQDINTINVDLSGWIRSLNDKKTHSIIDIMDEGLIPITDFIIEDNLKEAIFDIYKNGVKTTDPLQEPYILIQIDVLFMQGGEWKSYLVTRYGEKILLRYVRFEGESRINGTINHEVQRLKKIFGLRIVVDSQIGDDWRDAPVDTPFAIVDEFLGEEYMSKFVDPDNGTIYLLLDTGIFLDKDNVYTIHSDKILDEYVMQDFVNRLPVVNITKETLLRNYRLIAL